MINNIYLISRKDDYDYDEYDSFVISASSSIKARGIASENAGDECGYVWTIPKHSKIKKIGKTNQKEGVILASFNAG